MVNQIVISKLVLTDHVLSGIFHGFHSRIQAAYHVLQVLVAYDAAKSHRGYNDAKHCTHHEIEHAVSFDAVNVLV